MGDMVWIIVLIKLISKHYGSLNITVQGQKSIIKHHPIFTYARYFLRRLVIWDGSTLITASVKGRVRRQFWKTLT